MYLRLAACSLFLASTFFYDAPGGVEPFETVANGEAFLEQHCAGCHGGDNAKGDFRLSELEGDADFARGRWRDVLDMLAWEEMPPAGEPGPSQEASLAFQNDLQVRLTAMGIGADGDSVLPRAVRRLGNTEYKNTVLDVLGVDLDVESILPPDDVAHGFDVVGDALVLTPAHLERYLVAAERIAGLAIVLPTEFAPREQRLGANDLDLSQDFPIRTADDTLPWITMYSPGTATGQVTLESEGTYEFRFQVAADQAGPDLAAFEVRVDGEVKTQFEVPNERPEQALLTCETHLNPGNHRIEVRFANDYYRKDAVDPGERDRNFYLASIVVVGPVDRLGPTPLQRELTNQSHSLQSGLGLLAERLFRRPVKLAELRPYLALTKKKDPTELRMREALTAMLVSPHFLITGTEPGDYHLAAGLAWFLWRSTPDAELMRAAQAGELATAKGRRSQVERMLRAPRASSLATCFAEQWLQLGRLSEAAPDPGRFGDFDEALREAMRAETLNCFEAVLREDRPLCELLDADWTFVNERLAKHYGFPKVMGTTMRRVVIPIDQRSRRGGLLGQAGLLCVTSNPTRTSPVKRGKWILEALLDSAPPPPPPGVGALSEGAAADLQASLRERLALHRNKVECASCHNTMDALGLGLENFDAIGRWRERDGTHPIDASASLPDGQSFQTPQELRTILAQDGAFPRSLAKNLAVYALGRALTREDEYALARLNRSLAEDPTMKDIIMGIVELPGFLTSALEFSKNSRGDSR